MTKGTVVQEVHWTAGTGSPGLIPRDILPGPSPLPQGTVCHAGRTQSGLLFQSEARCPCPETDRARGGVLLPGQASLPLALSYHQVLLLLAPPPCLTRFLPPRREMETLTEDQEADA